MAQQGESFKDSSIKENAIKYFINTQIWSQEENIDIFFFSSLTNHGKWE
jgi:hypothetical protein